MLFWVTFAACAIFALFLAWVALGPTWQRRRRPHRADARTAETKIRRVFDAIKSGERGLPSEQDMGKLTVELFGGEIYDPNDEGASRRSLQRRLSDIVADRNSRK